MRTIIMTKYVSDSDNKLLIDTRKDDTALVDS